MSESPYLMPAGFCECETEVKKSRFIAWAEAVHDREQAMAVLHRAQAAYPDARHHCWAYQLGMPANNAGMGDDGEPGGTAGKPILNVLQHKRISNTVIVVSRYFGGVKLGAGGLVRAYSGAAQAVVDSMQLIEQQQRLHWQLQCSFAQEQLLRHHLRGLGGEVGEVAYGATVTLDADFPEEQAPAMAAFCAAQGVAVIKGSEA